MVRKNFKKNRRIDYRATTKIRPGSIIEYEIDHAILKSQRVFGFVFSIDWRTMHSNTEIHLIAHDGLRSTINVCSVCRIVIV